MVPYLRYIVPRVSWYVIWGILYLMYHGTSFEVYCTSCVMVPYLRYIVPLVSRYRIWGILYVMSWYLICGILLPHLRYIATSIEVYFYVIWAKLYCLLSNMEATEFTIWFIKQFGSVTRPMGLMSTSMFWCTSAWWVWRLSWCQ